jgi:hypothetical protein
MSAESRFLVTVQEDTFTIVKVERIGESGALTEIPPASFTPAGLAAFRAAEPTTGEAPLAQTGAPLGAYFPGTGPYPDDAPQAAPAGAPLGAFFPGTGPYPDDAPQAGPPRGAIFPMNGPLPQHPDERAQRS